MTALDITKPDSRPTRPHANGNAVPADAVSATRKERVEAAAAIARQHAPEVDTAGRFPEEAIAAIREQRLFGIMIPRELGGEGASVSDVVDVCYRLGQTCASTAMIFAMHQTKVACLVRHGASDPWQRNLLNRVAAEQLLLASSTTEGKAGGNVRSSDAAIVRDGDAISLERAATVISYGAYADGVVTTARRSVEADSSDQVLVAFLKDDYTLEPTVSWDTLGMRGTCSSGFALKATGSASQILPVSYDRIHAQTMTPVAHLAWAGVWTGIAAAAVEKARLFVRNAARHSKGQLPPAAARVTEASASLLKLQSLMDASLRRFEQAAHDERVLGSFDFQTAINLVKVDASELAVETVMTAMRACGLSGYRNDGDFTIGRHLRDVLSSPIMINNDRIMANAGASSLMVAIPESLQG
ncbi:MAG: acyl-CoA dehydrogenase family protein [Bauldia litoralis]